MTIIRRIAAACLAALPWTAARRPSRTRRSSSPSRAISSSAAPSTIAAGIADRRPHVCRIPGAAAAGAPLSRGDDPWRQPDRHQFHRHAGRARGLGAVFPAPRLCGLRGRPGGARPRRPVVAGERPGLRRQLERGWSSASSRRSASSCGRRRICTPSGRARASRAMRRSTSSTPASSPRWSISPCSRRSTATPPWRCSTASARPWCSSIRSPVRSSGRSPTSGRTSSRRSSRSSPTARRSTTSNSRARRTGLRMPQDQAGGTRRRAAHL